MLNIHSSEITPEHIYLSRRKFMSGSSKIVLGAALMAACSDQTNSSDSNFDSDNRQTDIDDLGDSWTSYKSITNYNNFYEFSVNKERVAAIAQDLRISPWEIEVGGLVKNPGMSRIPPTIQSNATVRFILLLFFIRRYIYKLFADYISLINGSQRTIKP